jgi:hypothetical protein
MKSLLSLALLGAALAAPSSAQSWALDRIDQRNLPLDGAGSPCTLDPNREVTVYVLGTGIRTTHDEFDGGRASYGWAWDNMPGDCNGFGTAVASLVGGDTMGVAPGSKLISVRVMNCVGAASIPNITAGLQWVRSDIASKGFPPSVVVVPFTGPRTALTTLLEAELTGLAVTDGVPVVIAAGNNSSDACNYTAALPELITVGASGTTDAKMPNSNWGPCLDLFAPGEAVPAANSLADTTYSQLGGTAASAGIVAGMAAVTIGAALPSTMPPAAVQAYMVSEGTHNVVSNPGPGSPNILAYMPTCPPYCQKDLGLDSHPTGRISVCGDDLRQPGATADFCATGLNPGESILLFLDVVPSTCPPSAWICSTLLACTGVSVTLGVADANGEMCFSMVTLPPGQIYLHAVVLSGALPFCLTNAIEVQY